MRARLTCLWRSSQVTQEIPAKPNTSLTWGAVGSSAEGHLIRVRDIGRGYAQADVDQALRIGGVLGVVRSDGSWAHTGPVTAVEQTGEIYEVRTDNGRYRLELLPAPSKGDQRA